MKRIWEVNSTPRKVLRKVFFENKFINDFKGAELTKIKISLFLIILLLAILTITLFYFLLKTKEEKQVSKPIPEVVVKEEKSKSTESVITKPKEIKPDKPPEPVVPQTSKPSEPIPEVVVKEEKSKSTESVITKPKEIKPDKPPEPVVPQTSKPSEPIEQPKPIKEVGKEVKISSEQTTVNIEKLCATISNTGDARNVKTFIPLNACQYLPTVKKEQVRLWPDHPMPHSIPALIEHESCITLRHSKCWNPKSQLKTAREEGAGLPQLTRAFRQDGSLRFDTLTDLTKKFNSELNELSWGNVYLRPDLQIRALMLLNRDNYKKLYSIENPIIRSHFNDAAYNGGLGGVNADRRLCGLKAGCDPQLWFENVETTCSKSKKVLYANRNACDINRHHVYDVFNNRSDKYKVFMQ